MNLLDTVDSNCCECCNTDDYNNASYFVPEKGRDVWLCEECAERYKDEIR